MKENSNSGVWMQDHISHAISLVKLNSLPYVDNLAGVSNTFKYMPILVFHHIIFRAEFGRNYRWAKSGIKAVPNRAMCDDQVSH
ncbi:hypothetical protein BDA96_07G201900 [Sorghum bicolor]|uniref:Uncharacterized protein n=1 Tax=Sorghum bicolor TaxID=4558 RepID=A0A921QQ40_SORBI|nr:hypothetical protein BDA96_07G201900 [Sorghum bicolor]